MHAQLLTISLNFKDQNSIKCVIFSVNVKHKSGHLTGTREVTWNILMWLIVLVSYDECQNTKETREVPAVFKLIKELISV